MQSVGTIFMIVSQDEFIEEDTITEIEEKAKAILENVVVRERESVSNTVMQEKKSNLHLNRSKQQKETPI